MKSIVTVLATAPSYDLTTLATAREELGAKRKNDAKLRRWITDASAGVVDYLGRPLALETVVETFRPPGGTYRGNGSLDHPRDAEVLRLSRYPVTSVSSVVIDGTELDPASDWEMDPEPALLYRLGPFGTRAGWYGAVIAVTYAAGYALPHDLPRPIGQACLLLLRHRWMTGDRDPTIRAENVSGVIDTQYWVGGMPGENAAVPPEAAALLNPYRELRI
jgi:hypothetical protein